MRQKIFIQKFAFLFWLQFAINHALFAQQNNCTFKETVVIIDFGSGNNVNDVNQSPLPKYNRVFDECPIDGNYALVSYTSKCFMGDWHTFIEDHTLNDKDGKMMLVNAN